jgi:membrane protease YdiL (CAAX protease family)
MFGGNNSGGILKMLPPFTTLYLATISSIIAGICEEFTCRGYILTRLEKFTGKTVMAILIQATLFGLYHGFTINTIYTTIFGIITSTIYTKTRRLIPIMMGHWLNDSIGFTITYLT